MVSSAVSTPQIGQHSRVTCPPLHRFAFGAGFHCGGLHERNRSDYTLSTDWVISGTAGTHSDGSGSALASMVSWSRPAWTRCSWW